MKQENLIVDCFVILIYHLQRGERIVVSNSKGVKGDFVILDGEKFYKLENYDRMDDFFMTITSSGDVWNFLWAKGGITAGRKNADHAIFQYGTADRVSDYKYTT